jgi:hypothetical protein
MTLCIRYTKYQCWPIFSFSENLQSWVRLFREHWGKGFSFQEQVIKYVEIFGQGSGSFILSFKMTSVACVVSPSVNPLQNRGPQHVNIVFHCMYQLFKQPNMKGNHA